MTEILAAILGVLAGGGVQAVVARTDRNREAESILTAICSEIAAICYLARYREYLPYVRSIADTIRAGNWNGSVVIVDLREDYFSVFNSLSAKLGLLAPKQASKIVLFYSICKAAIESSRPDGIFVGSDQNELKAANVLQLEALLEKLLELGDEIVQLPQQPIMIANP